MKNIPVCPQWASNWHVQSSDGNDSYLVQYHRTEVPSCSCKAYRYSGDYGHQSCKHIEMVRRHGCFFTTNRDTMALNDWEQQIGIQLMSTAGEIAGMSERCPGCGAHMITVIV